MERTNFLQMGLHPQLEGLFDPGDLTINARIGGRPNLEDPNRVAVLVEIESRTAAEVKFPYDFKVVMIGYFILNPDQPIEDRERAMMALKTTGASVLYSAARELIAVVTGRGPFPAVLLPTVVIALDEPPAQEQPTATKKAVRRGGAKKATKKGKAKKQQR